MKTHTRDAEKRRATVESSERPDARWRVLRSGLAIGLLPPLVAYGVNGRSVFEKTLTGMAQPWFVVIAIVILCGVAARSVQQRALGRWLTTVGLVAWILSTPLLTGNVVRWWESQIPSGVVTRQLPLDTLVVLGGGTGATPNGDAQLGSSGDRVMLAARLYHRGCVRRLVTTGDTLVIAGALGGSEIPMHSDPSEATRQIWRDLNIPDEVIVDLPGENTTSEVRSLREHPELWRGKRCGILTSAFHLPRAMRIARREGLELVPIASDYQGSVGPITVTSLLPDARALGTLQSIWKEWIGISIGR